MASDAKTRASRKYNDANTIAVKVSYHNVNDREIIERLEQKKTTEGKQGYVKRLIREDIQRGG